MTNIFYNKDENMIHDDGKIQYLFTIKDYKFANSYDKKPLTTDLHVFKLRNEWNEYEIYMEYCMKGFQLREFSDDIFLILENEVLKNLILYVPNSTEEKNKLKTLQKQFFASKIKNVFFTIYNAER